MNVNLPNTFISPHIFVLTNIHTFNPIQLEYLNVVSLYCSNFLNLIKKIKPNIIA